MVRKQNSLTTNRKHNLPKILLGGGSILFVILVGYFLTTSSSMPWNKPPQGSISSTKKEEEKMTLKAYYLDESGELLLKTSQVSSRNEEEAINSYIENFLYGKPATVEVYTDEDGSHARISISDLNFLDYYIKHPKVSENFPAYAVEGDTEHRIPMILQRKFAESIDRTIKETYGIQFVHWTIDERLEPNDGIIFGDIPKKSQEALEGYVGEGTYFQEIPDTELRGDSNPAVDAYNAKMAELRVKYPDGNIPAEELPSVTLTEE